MNKTINQFSIRRNEMIIMIIFAIRINDYNRD